MYRMLLALFIVVLSSQIGFAQTPPPISSASFVTPPPDDPLMDQDWQIAVLSLSAFRYPPWYSLNNGGSRSQASRRHRGLVGFSQSRLRSFILTLAFLYKSLQRMDGWLGLCV